MKGTFYPKLVKVFYTCAHADLEGNLFSTANGVEMVIDVVVWKKVAASRVSKLILPGMDLNGTISSSLAYLDKLKELNLSFNRLQGELSSEFSNLKQLQVLDLSHNMLSGPVGGAFSGLQSIQIVFGLFWRINNFLLKTLLKTCKKV